MDMREEEDVDLPSIVLFLPGFVKTTLGSSCSELSRPSRGFLAASTRVEASAVESDFVLLLPNLLVNFAK